MSGVIAWLGFPVRLWRTTRRLLTPASTTLILALIVSLNVVWGYPWLGVFACCVAMLAIGLIVNRLFRPDLDITVRCPASIPQGNVLRPLITIHNVGRRPALDCDMTLADPRAGSRHWRHSGRLRFANDSPLVSGDRLPLESLTSGSRRGWTPAVRAMRRGVHRLPQVFCDSMFPFYLFRSRICRDSKITIAVTPRCLEATDDPPTRQLIASLNQWKLTLIGGDFTHYVGNREYEAGVPVRRWDFASWARLGRPIVREYCGTSNTSIVMLVDTIPHAPDRSAPAGDEDLERLLSFAATVISQLSTMNIDLEMILTGEAIGSVTQPPVVTSTFNGQAMLIRLASAGPARDDAWDPAWQAFKTRSSHASAVIVSNRPPHNVDDPLILRSKYFCLTSSAEPQHVA